MADNESKFVPPEAVELTKTSEQTQADVGLSSLQTEIRDILDKKPDKQVSKEALMLLIPNRVPEIATNQNNIEVRQLPNQPGEISLLVIEKDYPKELTNPQSYSQWQKDDEAALEAQAGKSFKTTPEAPESINRLHAKFRTQINQGELSLKDRVLMTCRLRLYPDNPEALIVGDFDGEAHQGIGHDFYKNTLSSLAKSIGLRFIVGDNHSGNFSFFKDTLGRYTLAELKPEFQKTLFPGRSDDQFTIQFLYPEDIKKYVNNQ